MGERSPYSGSEPKIHPRVKGSSMRHYSSPPALLLSQLTLSWQFLHSLTVHPIKQSRVPMNTYLLSDVLAGARSSAEALEAANAKNVSQSMNEPVISLNVLIETAYFGVGRDDRTVEVA
jgi:hypothetical protein